MPPPDPSSEGLHRFSLRTPCKLCPFRIDVPPYLTRERAESIADDLRAGAPFDCHKTTVLGEDEEGEETLVCDPAVTKECLGSLATTLREGWMNQPALAAYRTGALDVERVRAHEQPVYDSLAQWVEAHEQAEKAEEAKVRKANRGATALDSEAGRR